MNKENLTIWLGAVVTILVAGLLFVYFRSASINSSKITEVAAKTEIAENIYVVQKGDSLWKIAKTQYNDGYNWKKIYESNQNQIANPNKIEVGTRLVIPKLEDQQNLKEYTVVKGDNLWKIATSQCGSGFQWVNIARQNELANPRLIYSGNILKFRCK